MSTARSAEGPTTVLTAATLLAEIGSVWLPATVAMAVIEPAAPGMVVIVAVARLPLARLPTVQRLPSLVIEP